MKRPASSSENDRYAELERKRSTSDRRGGAAFEPPPPPRYGYCF